MSHDVFISYSSHDKKIADAICSRLENSNIRCWIAPRDILGGVEFGAALVNAIGDCRILLLVFSAKSNDSPQVRREVERAIHKGKVVLPFRIEDVLPTAAMEFALSNTHWLDAMTPPLELHVAKLLDTVRRLLEPPVRDAPPPPDPVRAPPPDPAPIPARILSDGDLWLPETYRVDIACQDGEVIKNATLSCGPRSGSNYVASVQYTKDLRLIEDSKYGPSSNRFLRFDKLARIDVLPMDEEDRRVIGQNPAYRSHILKMRVTLADGTVLADAYLLDHGSFRTSSATGNLQTLNPLTLTFRLRD